MADQGRYHSTRTYIWSTGMVAVLFHTLDQSHTHMGQQSETLAHTGGIQYSLGLDQLYGSSPALGSIKHYGSTSAHRQAIGKEVTGIGTRIHRAASVVQLSIGVYGMKAVAQAHGKALIGKQCGQVSAVEVGTVT